MDEGKDAYDWKVHIDMIQKADNHYANIKSPSHQILIQKNDAGDRLVVDFNQDSK